jgi:four helix bundle protein
MQQLPFERMHVYGLAVKFAAACYRLCGQLPRGFGAIADQLRRASCSSLTNTTEAIVEYAPDEKSRIFRIGIRETAESLSLIALLLEMHVVKHAEVAEVRDFGFRLFCTLTTMAKPAQSR